MQTRPFLALEGLYDHVRQLFGDAVFQQARIRGAGASPDEIARLEGRIRALRDVLDLLDIMLEPAFSRAQEDAPA